MSEHWSREEVEATVSDYFDMLAMELRGELFNKAEHNRNLQRLLANRTHGSVERKHQNISAVMIDLGYPYIDGYKPLGNFQTLLCEVVEERLPGATELHAAAAVAVERTIKQPAPVIDLLAMQVPVPKGDDEKPKIYDGTRQIPRPVRKNYLEIEARNQTLGIAGERLILEIEHKRLWTAGKKALADRIEHVSATTGDHLGFDIKSFEVDGRDKLIEVKTTQFGSLTPFFATKNEVNVSEVKEATYHLFRLFHFTRQPQFFALAGSLRQTCALDPTQFSALPR